MFPHRRSVTQLWALGSVALLTVSACEPAEVADPISDWEGAELGISDETHELLIANCQEFCENRTLLGARTPPQCLPHPS